MGLLNLVCEAAVLALVGLDLIIWWGLKDLGKERKQKRKDRPGYSAEYSPKDCGTSADLRKFALKVFLASFFCSFLLVLVQFLCRAWG